jgi:hypothetical protein
MLSLDTGKRERNQKIDGYWDSQLIMVSGSGPGHHLARKIADLHFVVLFKKYCHLLTILEQVILMIWELVRNIGVRI